MCNDKTSIVVLFPQKIVLIIIYKWYYFDIYFQLDNYSNSLVLKDINLEI